MSDFTKGVDLKHIVETSYNKNMCKLCLKRHNKEQIFIRDISSLKKVLVLAKCSKFLDMKHLEICIECYHTFEKCMNFISMVQIAKKFWEKAKLKCKSTTKDLTSSKNCTNENEPYTNNDNNEEIDVKPNLDEIKPAIHGPVEIYLKEENSQPTVDNLFNGNNNSTEGTNDADNIDTNKQELKSKDEETDDKSNLDNTDNNLYVDRIDYSVKKDAKPKKSKTTKTKLVLKKQLIKKQKADVQSKVDLLKRMNIQELVLNEEEQYKEVEDRKRVEKYLEAQFKCDLCGWYGVEEDMWAKHMERHSELSGQYECPKCKYRFKNKQCLTSHEKKHKYNYLCLKCDLLLDGRSNFERHYVNCSAEETPLQCHLCNKMLKNSFCFKRHLRYHADLLKKNRYTCDYCSKDFQKKDCLRSHIDKHMSVKRFKCIICNMQLNSPYLLKHHLQTHKDFIKDESTYCVECNKHFKRLEQHYLYKHQRVDRKKHECEFCHKRFKCASILDYHKNSKHLNYKTYCCHLCPKKYAAERILRKHIQDKHLMNDNIKSHVCNICNKAFVNKESLEEHKNIHTNKRPFKCELCPASYNYSDALRTHHKIKHKINNNGPICEETIH